MLRLPVLIAVFCIGSGCAVAPPAVEAVPRLDAAEGTVWVVRDVRGGRQCGQEPFMPPDTAARLAAAGVEAAEVIVRPQAVCRSCDCPAYAASHYARIAEGDLLAARRLGFEEGAPPVDG